MKREQRQMKQVWMVEDATSLSPGDAPRSIWTKIGVAFENDDGSLSLHLAAIPVTGKMIVRDAMPFTARPEPRGAA